LYKLNNIIVSPLKTGEWAGQQSFPSFKLIGTVEFQWMPATARLNIRCIQDPSKKANYYVFVLEIRMPKKLEHFLSRFVAVIM